MLTRTIDNVIVVGLPCSLTLRCAVGGEKFSFRLVLVGVKNFKAAIFVVILYRICDKREKRL